MKTEHLFFMPLVSEIGVDGVETYHLSIDDSQMEIVDAIEHFRSEVNQREIERQAFAPFELQQIGHVDICRQGIMWHFQAREMLIQFPSVPVVGVYWMVHVIFFKRHKNQKALRRLRRYHPVDGINVFRER